MRRHRHCLGITLLEDRVTPSILFAAGSGAGVNATVQLQFDGDIANPDAVVTRPPETIIAFSGFSGGVRVAMGDVNGDGVADVVAAAGPGGGPAVKVFDGKTGNEIRSFFAYDPSFSGGVSVAVADIDRDGFADIVTGAGAGGGPHVKVFSGSDGTEIRSFLAYSSTFIGGVTVGAVDIHGDGFADIIVGAGPGGGPHIQVFDGDTGNIELSFFAFESTFLGGVSVAGGDFGGDREVEIAVGAGAGGGPRVSVFDLGGTIQQDFFAFDPEFLGGVNISAADLDGDRLDDLIASESTSGGAIRGFHGRSFEELFAAEDLDTFGAGVSIGGSLSMFNGGTGAEDAANFPNIPVLERVALFDPMTGTFGTVTAGSIPAGKNLYVVSHGWAPGYKSWVDDYFAATGEILKVWETDPADPNYAETSKYNTKNLPPAGAFLFTGMPPPANDENVVVSPSGLASIIAAKDPNAVILAFSWLDESATVGIISSIDALTGDVNVSEAHTTQNGIRLAQAVQQAVASNFVSGNGRIHLLGHSHGSKVVSVAAVELQRLGLTPKQVTVLDSPEDDLTQAFEAANFNWYFLQNLTISRNPIAIGGTFVDNYASYFGERYSNILLAGSTLSNIVDVTLDPSVIYPVSIFSPSKISTNIGASHSYAATWYAGTTNAGGDGGLAFSPLVTPVPTMPLAALYEQIWSTVTLDQQYQLTESESFPPLATVFPELNRISFDSQKTTGGATTTGGKKPTVTLNDSKGTSTWTGRFDPAQRATGIAFDYQFLSPGDGDTLTISIDGELVFVMEGLVAGTTARTATLSTGVLKPVFFFDDSLVVTLTSSGAMGNAAVTLNNFRLLTV